MTHFTHDIAPALASRADLKAAYERRLPAAKQALADWLKGPSRDFAAIRRSIEGDGDLNAAHDVAAHLSKNTTDVIVLGIGGSSLGAQTLAQLADWGTAAYAPAEGKPRLHIIDNPDGATFATLLRRIDMRTTRFLAVSKSGSTTESLMQTLAAIEALENAGGGKYLKHHFAGITEERANPLRAILTDMGAPILAHDPDLGGRYSVFSAVGAVPALLLGLDPRALRAGARATLAATNAAEGAALSVAGHDIGLSQSVMWTYADRLHYLPKWWRQLWAESLGKGGHGTTPIDALGPVDQHSQLQLYLDGPKDKLFTVIEAHTDADARANATWAQKHNLRLFAGRSMAEVVAAEARATAETLNSHARPARRITIPRLNEESLGALLTHFILETLVAARLWGVDPFGQPAVEEGKVLTRKYLGGPA